MKSVFISRKRSTVNPGRKSTYWTSLTESWDLYLLLSTNSVTTTWRQASQLMDIYTPQDECLSLDHFRWAHSRNLLVFWVKSFSFIKHFVIFLMESEGWISSSCSVLMKRSDCIDGVAAILSAAQIYHSHNGRVSNQVSVIKRNDCFLHTDWSFHLLYDGCFQFVSQDYQVFLFKSKLSSRKYTSPA